jgi:copper chaperone CopZ
MVCECAVDSIERSLRGLANVSAIKLDVREHTVGVEVITECKSGDLIRAIERTGFQVASCDTPVPTHA